MKKLFIFCAVFLLSTYNFGQEINKTDILELYIKEKNLKNISNKKIVDKVHNGVERIFNQPEFLYETSIYYVDEDIERIFNNNFEVKDSLNDKKKFKFSTKYKYLKNNYYQFSNVIISKDANYAAFREDYVCYGYCGEGNLVFMKKIDNKWFYLGKINIWMN
ncbi:hypothetical protein [Algoriella sp.]|uniref:hypothetical protein n=1 Tax=Algoriella sp. TaxID=1872434 RepID=UPI002FCBC66A